ncbi:hypothetical protein [Nocardiopsis suaedae]|uniref:Tyr recombinase domain-containing protein n=1 Tax=Nocardiopsis suaedae TaxID=3018444 RepID=A0ABT4TJV8_9ACTN|nr:hypothetical protein [Nocardiopsis suaedae]MDA2804971.1 hypothetical protein [Nocardiopsis suaedae]
MSWYEFARRYSAQKWPHISAKHRSNLAFALMMATRGLFISEAGRPDDALLHKALRRYAFNAKAGPPDGWPPEVAAALDWAARNTHDVSRLSLPPVVRAAVTAATTKLDGSKCALSTRRRNHDALKSALDWAVAEGLLDRNPIEPLESATKRSIHQVDRRCVVNPHQARALLEAVRAYGYEEDTAKHQGMKSDPGLVAFFGVMYYSGLRPEEAVNLRKHNLALPAPVKQAKEETDEVTPLFDWGMLHLERSTPDAGGEWTDSGHAHDEQPLKQREEGEGRSVPTPPALTRLLWEHLEAFGTDSEGRLFTGVKGGPLPTITYRRAWRWACGRP